MTYPSDSTPPPPASLRLCGFDIGSISAALEAADCLSQDNSAASVKTELEPDAECTVPEVWHYCTSGADSHAVVALPVVITSGAYPTGTRHRPQELLWESTCPVVLLVADSLLHFDEKASLGREEPRRLRRNSVIIPPPETSKCSPNIRDNTKNQGHTPISPK